MSEAGFEHTIIAPERAKTVHDLDRSATVTGHYIVAYLPHGRTAEPLKPRNTHATIELRVIAACCQATVSAPMNLLSENHVRCFL
jgi:hypothetical protein